MKVKILTTLIILSFCILVFNNQSEGTNERTTLFVKYLPDGSTQTFQHNIEYLAGENLSESIARTCGELVADDEQIQQYAEQQTGLFFLVSGGDGMHVALPPSGKYSRILEMYWQLVPCLLYCHYTEGGYSDITPIDGGANTNITVPHRILCIGFVGVLGWSRPFSFDDTGFAGFTPFLWYEQD